MNLFIFETLLTSSYFIDLFVYGTLVPGSNWIYPVVVGLAYSVIYYFLAKGIVIDGGIDDAVEVSDNKAAGVNVISDTQVQIIYGSKVNIIASGIKEYLGY